MKTKCVVCGTEHEWNTEQDYYPSCEELEVKQITDEIEVTVYICPCQTVLATFVADKNGGSLYIPCTEDL